MNSQARVFGYIICVLLCPVTVLSAYYSPLLVKYPLVLVLMTGFVMLLGWLLTGKWFGMLINERNLMSLARFQMILWTLVILAGYFCCVTERIREKPGDAASALTVQIDWQLWAAMGISTASLVGSPMILNTKKQQVPDATVVAKAATLTGEQPADVTQNSQGTLYANSKVSDASFTDMFQGDEIGNTAYLDLAKVQMFFFTIISVSAFFLALYSSLRHQMADQLPSLPEGFVSLMGISHAGYLTSKGVNHT